MLSDTSKIEWGTKSLLVLIEIHLLFVLMKDVKSYLRYIPALDHK